MYCLFNFRFPFLIHLFLSSCLIAGIKSAPIENTDEEFASESKLSESLKDAPKGLNLPFVNTISSGIGGKNATASGFPGLPDLSSATAGAKFYVGTFQVVAAPMPDISDFVKLFGNFGKFGNLPTIPGLPNPGATEPSS